MVARVWQAQIDSGRGHEYDAFALERSLATFRAHGGFRGCAFLGDGANRMVLTLWDSMDDIEALERSPRYRETVAAIMGTGFIVDAAPALTAIVRGQPDDD